MYGAFFAPTPRRDPRPYVNCNKVVDCHYGLLGCLFFGGGKEMQKRVRNSRNFTPGGGASAVTQFPSVWEIY